MKRLIPESAPNPQPYTVRAGRQVSHGGIIYLEGETVELSPETAKYHRHSLVGYAEDLEPSIESEDASGTP